MLAYLWWGGLSIQLSIFLLLVAGALVNGPYCLITTAVSQDLGQHPVLRGSRRAVATVTAIIDGTGSIGIRYQIYTYTVFRIQDQSFIWLHLTQRF